MTRQEMIAHGRLWHVYPPDDNQTVYFEGSKTQCLNFIRDNYGMRAYRKGTIRLGQIIWEPEPNRVAVKFEPTTKFAARVVPALQPIIEPSIQTCRGAVSV